MKAMFAWPPAAAGPAIRAARGGLSGRRVQAIVIGLVALASTAASTLALGLLVASNAPFDHAFAAQRGADVTATARASAAQLAATTHLPGVTAAAGPFPETTVTAQIPVSSLPGAGGGPSGGPSGGPPPGQTAELRQQLTVVGRSSPGARPWAGGLGGRPDGGGPTGWDADHRDRRAGHAEADHRRHRDVDHRQRAGLGDAGRAHRAAGARHPRRHADAVPVRPRGN